MTARFSRRHEMRAVIDRAYRKSRYNPRLSRFMSLSAGMKLGHYEIGAAIGAGGMGEVFRATDTKLGRAVALKVLPAAMADDPERLARFQREARAVAALNHPNIVTIYSVEEEGGIHFLTMELVEGQPLSNLIPERGFPIERILATAASLADALAAAHERGIVHRDLKPANIMLTNDGRLKVLDFGLAKDMRPAETPDVTAVTAQDLTQAGVVMGTPAYMSPEQVSGRGVDHRSDIFSLGVILYQMTTGRRPFEGATSIEIASSILRRQIPHGRRHTPHWAICVSTLDSSGGGPQRKRLAVRGQRCKKRWSFFLRIRWRMPSCASSQDSTITTGTKPKNTAGWRSPPIRCLLPAACCVPLFIVCREVIMMRPYGRSQRPWRRIP
jgi:serine/threonine protein kinase